MDERVKQYLIELYEQRGGPLPLSILYDSTLSDICDALDSLERYKS